MVCVPLRLLVQASEAKLLRGCSDLGGGPCRPVSHPSHLRVPTYLSVLAAVFLGRSLGQGIPVS